MKIYAISDLHLSLSTSKPMDIFGGAWENYFEKIKEDWQKVKDNDIVLIGGDISWAMTLNDAKADLDAIADLSGKKIIIRGNHDYWWSSIKKIREMLDDSIFAIQNDVVRIGNVLVFGTRGWNPIDKDQTEEDKKIYAREIERLKLSVKAMKKEKREGDTVIGMIHYPPFDATFTRSPLTDIFTDSGVKKVIYGHIHGKSARVENIVKIDGVEYYLTSCDLVNNHLVEIY